MTLFDAARMFIYKEARLLEQRLFATLFEDAPASGAVRALRGFQNDDGGFGHALEPDKRCPASLPLDVELAFQALVAAGTVDEPMVRAACDYLTTVTNEAGAVPLAFPVIEEYPRADEWADWTYVPGVFPTAGLAGLLYEMGVDHPWRSRAADYCWASIEEGLPDDAHALLQVSMFLEHTPERDRAERFVPLVAEALPKVRWYRADAADPGYGVTPLHFAPTPESFWRPLFSDDLVEAHLDRYERDQQPDGGWALTWEPPSQAATLEYRGMETVRALRVLAAYGRLKR